MAESGWEQSDKLAKQSAASIKESMLGTLGATAVQKQPSLSPEEQARQQGFQQGVIALQEEQLIEARTQILHNELNALTGGYRALGDSLTTLSANGIPTKGLQDFAAELPAYQDEAEMLKLSMEFEENEKQAQAAVDAEMTRMAQETERWEKLAEQRPDLYTTASDLADAVAQDGEVLPAKIAAQQATIIRAAEEQAAFKERIFGSYRDVADDRRQPVYGANVTREADNLLEHARTVNPVTHGTKEKVAILAEGEATRSELERWRKASHANHPNR
jgi:hypothetical protein